MAVACCKMLALLRREVVEASAERLLVITVVDVAMVSGMLSARSKPCVVSNVMLEVVNTGGMVVAAVVVRFVVDTVIVVVVEVEGTETALQAPRFFTTS